MSRTAQQQLEHFLSDMYSVELQALAQLETAPDIAGESGLSSDLAVHHGETERQAELVKERLEACGGSPSAIKDAIMKLGGKGFLAFARMQPETPGRLLAHAYSYEAMEWAGYDMLARMAEHVGDQQTMDAAMAIRAEERTMMQRLERRFDAVEEASFDPDDDVHEELRKHLAEAHALEEQGKQLLQKSKTIAGSAELERLYRDHLEKSAEHARAVERRLEELGGDTSGFKDVAMKFGGLNWGLFFQAQSDTPSKLAAFVYAFEHLEIGGYELLKRVARRAADTETEELCERILAEEREMTESLVDAFDGAVHATFEEVRA